MPLPHPVGETPSFSVPAITAGSPIMRSFREAYRMAGAKRQVLKIYNRSDAEAILRLDNGEIIRVDSQNFFEKKRPGGIAWYTVDASVDVAADKIEVFEEDLPPEDEVEDVIG